MRDSVRRLSLCVALSLLFAAGAARATTILPVEDRRFNQGTGARPATETPGVPFAPFASAIGNIVGDALHESRIDPTVLSGMGQVITDGGGGAGGTSHFELVFRVSQAAAFTWSGSIFSSWIDTDAQGNDVAIPTPALRTAELSAGGTLLLAVDRAFSEGGRLFPGVDYTLRISASNEERPFEDAAWSFAFRVASVPEPGPRALLLSALCVLCCTRRRIVGHTAPDALS